jgi:hypothetical protein
MANPYQEPPHAKLVTLVQDDLPLLTSKPLSRKVHGLPLRE